ncbi:hypothetical protein LJR290_007926 [Variovorax sp. LjRoot290]|uniref:hypothetical protein n=1 Tax=Variovorax sp. LjRoot290 TaxID=3342316 RepID=UPI003ECC32E5
MTSTTDSITLADGKYTVELGTQNGRFSFTALRNGLPWRDMSADGDGMMLAMFQKLLEQQDRIAQLERAAQAPIQRTLQRWDVEDGTTEPVEAEPTYTMTMDPHRGLLEIRPAGLSDDQLVGLPQMLAYVEIMNGLPRLIVQTDIISGEVEAQFISLPDGRLVDRLYAMPDIQAIGEQIRARGTARSESTESHQAPRA